MAPAGESSGFVKQPENIKEINITNCLWKSLIKFIYLAAPVDRCKPHPKQTRISRSRSDSQKSVYTYSFHSTYLVAYISLLCCSEHWFKENSCIQTGTFCGILVTRNTVVACLYQTENNNRSTLRYNFDFISPNERSLFRKTFYQTVHLLVGFIKLPAGQLNVWENSGKLTKGPITRKLPEKLLREISTQNSTYRAGEWGSVLTWILT